ncbi:MAG: amino acid ABC transporter permease [Candidatus Berkiella sp.]
MRQLFQLYYNLKVRSVFYQGLFLSVLIWGSYLLWEVLQNNLHQRDIEIGFGFLKDTAGFSIILHLIPYDEQSSYFQVFLVGLLNTLLVSLIGILFATVIGFFIGIARISSHRLFRLIGTFYVETVRNIPLLLQIFVWYFVVLRAAPYPQQAITIFDNIFITNRGIYLPKPECEANCWVMLILIFLSGTLSLFFLKCNKNTCLQKGKTRSFYLGLSVFLMICVLIEILQLVSNLQWTLPTLGRFNFQDGITILPEFLALLLALSIYTGAYIAEVVRMGIISVSKGQWEASLSLGLSKWQTLRFIIIPQSLRVILPPLTNQFLNLTKNSSLATAIAYPDLVSIFAGTALNQTGQAVEIIAITMAVYLFISLSISGLMQSYEHMTRWGSRK